VARKQAEVVTGMRGAEVNPLLSASPETPPVAPVYPAAEAQDGEWVFQSNVRQLQVSLKLTRGFVKGEEYVPGETITAKFKEWTFRTDDEFVANALMFEMAKGGKFKLDPRTKERVPNKNFGLGKMYWLRTDAESVASEAIIDQFKQLAAKAADNPALAKKLATDPQLKSFVVKPAEPAQEEATE
jgi:hypothetical protein